LACCVQFTSHRHLLLRYQTLCDVYTLFVRLHARDRSSSYIHQPCCWRTERNGIMNAVSRRTNFRSSIFLPGGLRHRRHKEKSYVKCLIACGQTRLHLVVCNTLGATHINFNAQKKKKKKDTFQKKTLGTDFER
jgi:hypothetical protein